MKIRVVESLPEFDRLGPLWRELMTAGRLTSPFRSHDWFACCWRTAGPNRQRQVLVVEDAEGPVAMVPLVRWRSSVRSLPVTMVSLMEGPGQAMPEIPIARRRNDVMASVVDFFAVRRDWDLLVIPGLVAGSPSTHAVLDALTEHSLWSAAAQDIVPHVVVAGTWQRYLRDRARWLEPILAAGAALERSGALQVEEHANLGAADALFAEVMELAEDSWASPRGLVTTPPETYRFFRALCRRASANDWLRLWVLRHEGRVVAAELQLQNGTMAHVVRTSRDPATPFAAFLRASILKSFFASNKVQHYDLGAGTGDDLLRWSTSVRETMTVRVYAETNYGRLLHNVRTRLVPLARRWRAQLGRTG